MVKVYSDTLRIIKDVFEKKGLNWFLVSGASVHLYHNPQRPLTDLDVLVFHDNIHDLESILSLIPEIDGLSQVRFLKNFGVVKPLTTYLKMVINGIEVHASTQWLYRSEKKQLIEIPFDTKSYQDSNLVKVDGFKIKVARPELIFFCKSVTRRTYRSNWKTIAKDLSDCELLIKNNKNFDPIYLKNLYEKAELTEIFRKVAHPLLIKYNLNR